MVLLLLLFGVVVALVWFVGAVIVVVVAADVAVAVAVAVVFGPSFTLRICLFVCLVG